MKKGLTVLLFVLPLAATLVTFYVWTLRSLRATIRDLDERSQIIMANMYRGVWRSIILSIALSFAFFIFNCFNLASASDPDFTPQNWYARWFTLDGWLNVLYLGNVTYIAYIWRPTAENRRLVMSNELAKIANVHAKRQKDDEDAGAYPCFQVSRDIANSIGNIGCT